MMMKQTVAMRRVVCGVALVLCCMVAAGDALYSSRDPVVQLTAANFDKLVMRSSSLWIVEFYAPWCGHCKQLAPEYIKAAKKLYGSVKLGAVDCDVESNKVLAGRYGIKGFPTIKVFGKNKRSPIDYQQARSAKAIADFALMQLPNQVTKVTEATHGDFAKLGAVPKALLFTDKRTTASLYKGLALELDGRMELGQVRVKDQSTLVDKYGVTSFPTLLVLKKQADSEDTEIVAYDGEIKAKALQAFLEEHALEKKARTQRKKRSAEEKEKEKARKKAEREEKTKARKSKKAQKKSAGGGAGGGSDVVVLDANNFEELVLNSPQQWMVEFYAPWCGHCQRLAPEWEEAATALRGVVRYGKIDCTQEEALAREYGIQGFPTIKLFRPDDKDTPVDYTGPRSAKHMAKFSKTGMPSRVVSVTGDSVDDFVAAAQKESGVPAALLFSKKHAPSPLYKALALDLEERMVLGQVHAGEHADVAATFGVTDVPALVVLSAKAGADAVPYDGEMAHEGIWTFLNTHALPARAGSRSGVPLLETETDWQRRCLDKGGLCVVFLLASADDADSAVLGDVAARRRRDPFKFMSVDATRTTGFNAAVRAGGAGLPTAVVVHPRKGMAAPFVGAWTSEGLNNWLIGVLSGSSRTVQVGDVPALFDAVEEKVEAAGEETEEAVEEEAVEEEAVEEAAAETVEVHDEL